MDTDEIKSYFTDKVKLLTLLAKISIFAAAMFLGYGYVSNEMRIMFTGAFFVICFFGFWYGKRILQAREDNRVEQPYHNIEEIQHRKV